MNDEEIKYKTQAKLMPKLLTKDEANFQFSIFTNYDKQLTTKVNTRNTCNNWRYQVLQIKRGRE